jgi:hypothetical protein
LSFRACCASRTDELPDDIEVWLLVEALLSLLDGL